MRANFLGGGAEGDGLSSTALGVRSPSPDEVPLYEGQVNQSITSDRNDKHYSIFNPSYS